MASAFPAEYERRSENNQREYLRSDVTGTVFYINQPHRYYAVKFSRHGYTLVECFKF